MKKIAAVILLAASLAGVTATSAVAGALCVDQTVHGIRVNTCR